MADYLAFSANSHRNVNQVEHSSVLTFNHKRLTYKFIISPHYGYSYSQYLVKASDKYEVLRELHRISNNCAKLFLQELRQISTNFDNFWQNDGKRLQEALPLQRNRATRCVCWNIMAVFWPSYWQGALLIQRNHASSRIHCQLKSCKMLHKCSTDCMWKRLQPMDDLRGHSRSLPLPPFDRPYTIYY